MRRTAVVRAGAGVLAALAASAPVRALQPTRIPVVAVVGCAAEDGTGWRLTGASAPAAADGTPARPAAGSVEWARRQPAGTKQYRLIGRPVLEEFRIAAHRGHRVVVRGLVVGDGGDERLNVISVAMVAHSCN